MNPYPSDKKKKEKKRSIGLPLSFDFFFLTIANDAIERPWIRQVPIWTGL
jgi:hypothetical protein